MGDQNGEEVAEGLQELEIDCSTFRALDTGERPMQGLLKYRKSGFIIECIGQSNTKAAVIMPHISCFVLLS